jgi:hypothetical protein
MKSISELIPPDVLRALRDRIKGGIADAEAKFHLNDADEDAVTGALGQAISTAEPILFSSTDGDYALSIVSRKIRGRGLGAPEKHLGADGIFQIRVDIAGKTLFTKGLPFQCKMRGGFSNQSVRKQATDLFRTAKTGVIIRYSEKGYSGVDVRDMPKPSMPGLREIQPPVSSLASIFGEHFLNCEIGLRGLTFDREKDFAVGRKGAWVIDTLILGLTD